MTTPDDANSSPTASARRGRWSIPPQILYPGIVLTLLFSSVAAQVWLVISSQSDGGVQIEEDYYQRAVEWDDQAARRKNAENLGLALDVQLTPSREGFAVARVAVVDRDGRYQSAKSPTLTVRRPSRAAPVAIEPLATPDPARPGQYVLELPIDRAGLWDFVVEGEHAGRPFVVQVRREVTL